MNAAATPPLPLLAKVALRAGLLDEAQVARCRAMAAEREERGEPAELGEIALALGLIDAPTLEALRVRVEQAQLWCPACNKPFAVVGLPPGKTVPCPTCKRPLRPRGTVDGQLTTYVGTRAGAADRAPPIDDALVGQVLGGKYRLEAKIGQGGMGAVYRATHVQLGRAVAIKVLPHELAQDAALVARLRQEARATAQVESANIVQIYDADRDPAMGIEFLAMELIAGRSLDAWLAERGRLPWRECAALVRQAAAGLGAAHAKGVIHRDVKPANLMLTTAGTVKVMDFGLARLAEGASHLSQTGQILGTPHYMSPEQAHGEELDPRTDVYSLGVTLFALATGRTPFLATSPAALLLKVIDAQAPTATSLVPEVPAELSRVIAKAMAKRAADRYPAMDAFAADLSRLERGERPLAPSVVAPAALPRMEPRPQIRGRHLAAAVLLVAAGIAAGAVLGGGGSGTPDVPPVREVSETGPLAEVARLLDESRPTAERLALCREFLAQHPESPQAPTVRELAATLEARGAGSGIGSTAPIAGGSAIGPDSPDRPDKHDRPGKHDKDRAGDVEKALARQDWERAVALFEELPIERAERHALLPAKVELARVEILLARHAVDEAAMRLDAFEEDAEAATQLAGQVRALRLRIGGLSLAEVAGGSSATPVPPPTKLTRAQLDLDEVWRVCESERFPPLLKSPLLIAGEAGRAQLRPFGTAWKPSDGGLHHGTGLIAVKLDGVVGPRLTLRFAIGKPFGDPAVVVFVVSRTVSMPTGVIPLHLLIGLNVTARVLTFAHLSDKNGLTILAHCGVGEIDLSSPELELVYEPGLVRQMLRLTADKRSATLDFKQRGLPDRGQRLLYASASRVPAHVGILAVGTDCRLHTLEVSGGR